VAEKFDRVREAGFDGMAIDLGALTLEQGRIDRAAFCAYRNCRRPHRLSVHRWTT